MPTRIPYQWGNANFAWNNNPYTWDDVAFIIDVIQGGGSSPTEYINNNKEKKKKFIKLLCKVEGTEYKESKEVLKRQIRITDIKLVAKEVLGVEIKINK
jgi:hypothetical protein